MKICNVDGYLFYKRLKSIAYDLSDIVYNFDNFDENDPTNATLMPIFGDVYQLDIVDCDCVQQRLINIPKNIIEELLSFNDNERKSKYEPFCIWYTKKLNDETKRKYAIKLNATFDVLHNIDLDIIQRLTTIKNSRDRLKAINDMQTKGLLK